MNADEQTIRAKMAAFRDAWNVHNAGPLAALFAPDADFVNVMGMWWRGRDEIERNHAGPFASVLSESRMTFKDTSVRFLRPDVAVVHVNWQLAGQKTPDGHTTDRNGVLTATATKENGDWQIAALHNTDAVQPAEYKPYTG